MDPANELHNPCLGYHDPQKRLNCAQCKPGLARILAMWTETDGARDTKMVICGSVRTPERDEQGVYTYLDPESYTDE